MKAEIESLRRIETSQDVLVELTTHDCTLQKLHTQAKNFVDYHNRFSRIPTSKRHLQ